MIGPEDENIIGVLALDNVNVLIDGVGRTEIPVLSVTHPGLQDIDIVPKLGGEPPAE
jgi:hypothetical protein